MCALAQSQHKPRPDWAESMSLSQANGQDPGWMLGLITKPDGFENLWNSPDEKLLETQVSSGHGPKN